MNRWLSHIASDATQEKLSKTEQEVIIRQALNIDARGFSLELNHLAIIANLLINQDLNYWHNYVGKT